jgi:hypothetical protein
MLFFFRVLSGNLSYILPRGKRTFFALISSELASYLILFRCCSRLNVAHLARCPSPKTVPDFWGSLSIVYNNISIYLSVAFLGFPLILSSLRLSKLSGST